MFRTLALAVVQPVVGVLVGWSMDFTLLILGGATLAIATLSRVTESHIGDLGDLGDPVDESRSVSPGSLP